MPHARTDTVPSGCSQVIVPLYVMVGSPGIPPLPNGIDITIVQSYRARPELPGASNRRPPVVRAVEVELDRAPPGVRSNVETMSIRIAGSPLIVTVCDRHPVNSMREDEVNVLDVPAPALVHVIDMDPPFGQDEVRVRDSASGETVMAVSIAARLTAAATIPCVAAMPDPEAVPGVDPEGADGPCPPHAPRRPRASTNAPNEHARIGGILPDRLGLRDSVTP